MNYAPIIQQLRSERDFLLSQQYVSRDVGRKLITQLDSSLIKVITGPRRAGKSTLGIQALQSTGDFVYINFDSLNIMGIEDMYSFVTTIAEEFQNKHTVFLDEIQNVGKFELLVSQLHRNGFNIVMTGSNAHLLSRELATHLTGRYTQIEVLPFSYLEATQLIPKLSYLDYLKLGGFPEQLKSQGKSERYLETLFESIVLKDIVARYSVRNTYDLMKLSTYLMNTTAQNSNYTRLKNKLSIGSVNTVIDYYSYLTEAYLIYSLKQYSTKSSEIVKSDFKTYLIDTGICTANTVKFEEQIGYLFENSIFIELARKGYVPDSQLFQVVNTDHTQVDFYIKTDKNILIQACLSVRDNTTRDREFHGILNSGIAFDEAYLVVLNKTESALSDGKIKVIGIEDWLQLAV